MSITFTCEQCGKQFKVDERSQGRRGRCSVCGHVMRIPVPAVAEPEPAPVVAAEPAADLPFRLSPPEPHPLARHLVVPDLGEPTPHHQVEPHRSAFVLEPSTPGARESHANEPHARFELLDDGDDLASGVPVSPAIARGLEEAAEFEKSRQGYHLEGERIGGFSFFGRRSSGPAGWLTTKWRAGVGSVLRLFRWVDTWAYLISIPFVVLMILGIAAENRSLIHTGAVVVVLANYGRFWADLLAFFVRPYKDGPLQGLAFLFPPYMVYYLATRWDAMKKIVRRIATSCIPILAVVLVYAFDPSANPEAETAHGVGAKLEAGKHQLDREIASELNDLGKRLNKVAVPKENGPKDRR
jgi:DNA-directed RNA polymerase subunit RPC12/RpoP